MNLNISGVNYTPSVSDVGTSTGAGTSTSGQVINSQVNGQLSINIPGGLSSSEAGIALLQRLNTGDVFTGEITNITQNQITLALSDTVLVAATLSDALAYNIGETASFSIKDNSGEQIILKSVNHENLKNLMNDQTVRAALTNANLAINDTTVSLVHNLMKQELPIDSNTLNEYSKILSQAGNATPEDIIFLTKMGIEVNEENVAALHDYYDYSSGIASKAEDISGAITEMFAGNDMYPSDAGALLNNIVSGFSDTVSLSDNINVQISQEELNSLAGHILELPLATDEEGNPIPDKAINQLAVKISEGNITAKDLLSELAGILDNNKINKETFNSLLNSREFHQITDDMVRQQLFLNPSDISKSNMHRIFAKIINDSDSIAQKLAGNDKASAFVTNMQNVKQDIQFLNNINHFMNFVQLPIKMSGQNAHGDLYVYNNRKGGKDNDDLTAFLHLDMDNLGPMDIYVKLEQQNVTTNFKVESEDILNYIESNMELLTARLNKLGYNVNSTAAINDNNYSFKKNIIEHELPPKEIKRFSFDVRA